MKKLISVVLCLLLAFSFACAEEQPRRLAEDDPACTWLYEKTLTMAAIFDEAVHSDDCIALAMYDFPPFIEIDEADLERIRMQNYTQPLDVIMVRADCLHSVNDPNSLRAKIEEMEPLPAYATILARSANLSESISLWDQNNTQSEFYIASSLCFTDVFVCPEELDGSCYTVAMYGELYAFLVSFYPTDNGVVFATATLIPSRAVDDLNLPLE